jgi:transposase
LLLWYDPLMQPDTTTIINEQANSVPFLLALMEDLGIRAMIDAHLQPHGHWQGARPGTLVTIWLAHILSERSHCLVALREWAAARTHTIQTLLGIALRPTDCTDDRLANLLSMLGRPRTQETLDAALTQQWIRVYRLPTDIVRLDSTSVSVYHDLTKFSELLQRGHSKDYRPDLAQFKAMLATLDPLGLPLCCQTLPGNRADDPLYIPAYEAAVDALGHRDVLVVGDAKMAALETRGHLTAYGSRYLCRLLAPWAAREIAAWVEEALRRRQSWERLERVDPRSGHSELVAEIDSHQRQQSWIDPATKRCYEWTERVLLVRGQAFWRKEQRHRQQVLDRLTTDLGKLCTLPTQGRRRYRSQAELARVVEEQITKAGLAGVVCAPLVETVSPSGQPCWIVESIAVEVAAWHAHLERLGWQVCLTSTTRQQCSAATVLETYHGQAVHERDFARLKSRAVHIRPVYVRDEQRIAGLVWVLMLGLRVLVMGEQRLRAALAERGESLAGLNPASRAQGTTRPTTERVLAAFQEITLTHWQGEDGNWHGHITPLNATQRRVIALLGLPADLYERLAHGPPNFATHLRE